MAYEVISRIYDELMEEVDYATWCDFMEELFLQRGKTIHHIFELGCGSGIMTEKLLQKGYEVVGVDSSEKMLELAQERLEGFGKNIILMWQDIQKLDFEIYEIDCIFSSNDTLNYILEIGEMKKLFSYLYERLKVGGSFVFDISSEYKLKTVLGNNVFGQSFEDVVYLWENEYEESTKQLEIRINVFEQEEGGYRRYEEIQRQRAYSEKEIVSLLQETGYKEIQVYGDFLRDSARDKAERLFFCAVK